MTLPSLLCRWLGYEGRVFWRRLRLRMGDWRSDSRVAFGGPLAGQRLKLHLHPNGGMPVPIEVWAVAASGQVSCLYIPTYCEGVYERDGNVWRWQQWAQVGLPIAESGEEQP